MKEKFIPPYNYCNYRCEKCPDLRDCTVVAKEVVREAELVVQGKDPEDQKVIFEQVKHVFEETIELLHKIAAEEEISLDGDLQDYSPPAPEAFLLVQLAHQFNKNISSILEEDIPVAIDNQTRFREQITDLAWDANLIPAKLYRALTGKWEAERETDNLMKEVGREDSLRSAEVASKALNNCLDILGEVSKVVLDGREKVSQLIDLGKNLKTHLYEEFHT